MLKKLNIITFVVCLVILLSSCEKINNNSKEDNKTFLYLSGASDLENILSRDGEYIYFGKDTCKYCRVFMSIIKDVTKDSNVKINIFDIDKYKKDDKVKALLGDNDFKTVPQLFYVDKDKSIKKIDHMASKNQIIEFLKLDKKSQSEKIFNDYILLTNNITSVDNIVNGIEKFELIDTNFENNLYFLDNTTDEDSQLLVEIKANEKNEEVEIKYTVKDYDEEKLRNLDNKIKELGYKNLKLRIFVPSKINEGDILDTIKNGAKILNIDGSKN